jgi:Glyoxalase-like domain
MSLNISGITLHCVDCIRMAKFWSVALGRSVQQIGDRWQISLTDTSEQIYLAFQEGGDEASDNLRLRLRVRESLLAVQVARLLLCGASIVHNDDPSMARQKEVILQDPEGHIFVVEQGAEEGELWRSLNNCDE